MEFAESSGKAKSNLSVKCHCQKYSIEQIINLHKNRTINSLDGGIINLKVDENKIIGQGDFGSVSSFCLLFYFILRSFTHIGMREECVWL
ncbi:unnamed protein product [Meloidogyne enterolobii]|uniref:Uncharacterized protein n=1 Tax=Meloidogyne enterolobii TaxID=390850 RepID=A0ACB0ZR29_MELEN